MQWHWAIPVLTSLIPSGLSLIGVTIKPLLGALILITSSIWWIVLCAYRTKWPLVQRILCASAVPGLLLLISYKQKGSIYLALRGTTENSVLLSCETLHSPVLIKAGTSISVMDLVGNKVELGLSEVQPMMGDAYWPPPPWSLMDETYKCEVSNYTPETLLNAEMTFTILQRESIREGTSRRSGKTVATQTDKIVVGSLNKDGATAFTFYIHNSTKYFVELHPPTDGLAKSIRSEESMNLEIRRPSAEGHVMFLPPWTALAAQ